MSVPGVHIALSVFFWITFSLASVALFAPFWLTTDISKLIDGFPALAGIDIPLFSQGQLVTCVDPYDENGVRDCEWIIGEDEVRLGFTIPSLGGVTVDSEVELPDELEASQYLSIIGAGLFLLGGVLALFSCGMQSRKAMTAVLLVIGILGGKTF